MADIRSTDELDDEDLQRVEYHLAKVLDVVGLDHNFIDGLIDAVDHAVSIAQED